VSEGSGNVWSTRVFARDFGELGMTIEQGETNREGRLDTGPGQGGREIRQSRHRADTVRTCNRARAVRTRLDSSLETEPRRVGANER
jgi:hypothetical protein